MGLYQVHRGPDAWGEWDDDRIAFGHNRLAILDLSGGTQPMASSDGRYEVIFNGEIYNFSPLRAAIASASGVLRTDHSDTEAIVEGFRVWGPGIFDRLSGMFAIALWDTQARTLYLARDRMGQKPLYWVRPGPGRLAFASEPKALLAAGVAERTIENEQLPAYFLFRAPLHPQTLFRGMAKVPPGTLLTFVDGSGPTERPLTAPHDARRIAHAASGARPEREAAVLDALGAACRSHTIADVPVGIFLSGGVDSSLVASLVAEIGRLTAFTVGTDGPLDESGYAAAVARHLGTELTVRRVTDADTLAHFAAWTYYNDDPVADPSALALMILCEDVHARGYKVMLAGEGSDELFGGYVSYLRYVACNRLRPLAGLIPAVFHDRFDLRIAEYLFGDGPDYRGTAHISTATQRARMLPGAGAGVVAPANGGACSAIRHALAVDQRWRLPNDLLMRTDRASMAYSIEVRVPFLADEVIDVAAELPDNDLVWLPLKRGKPLLKRLAAARLPRGTVYRRKIGFELPLAKWLANAFREPIEDRLAARRLAALDYGYVRRLYEELRQGRDRLADLLWAWFVLEGWHARWCESVPEPDARPLRSLARRDQDTLHSAV